MLVREGAGYDEVFQLGHEPKEGFSWSSERETFAHSPDDEGESYDEGEEEEGEEGEDEDDEGGKDEEYGGEDDGDKVRVMREPLREEVQEASRMATLVSLFSPTYGPSMTLSQ